MLLPFAPGITGTYTEEGASLKLELKSLRNPQLVKFKTSDQTIINTIKQRFSPILEDYLSDYLPGFSDAFLKMQSYYIPDAGKERIFEIADGIRMNFCWIPPGESQLGSSKEEQDYLVSVIYNRRRSEWMENEAETVRGMYKTTGFWMGKYPVTQSQWKSVIGYNPSYFKGDKLPVENVNWHDCYNFIKKCDISGLKPQLPHEDQWEYACRGGKGNKQAFYWGNELNGDKANCAGVYPCGTDKKGAYLQKTSEVGSYEKIATHPWNLCDILGNVREWCDNLYASGHWGGVVRGGSWFNFSWDCRSSYRHLFDKAFRSNRSGFRLIIC